MIDASGGYLFTDFRYIEAAKKRIGEGFCVDMVRRSYADMVNAACRQDGVKTIAYEEGFMTCADYTQWEQALEAKMVPMGSLLGDLREVKRQEEVDCCIAAQRIAGKKASMPHGVPSEKLLEPGDFVTMDFGCTVEGYCSDMTRTVAVEYATEEMEKVYHIVLRAQEAGIAAAKPGVTGAMVDKAARDIIAAEGYGSCFGHSFGHGIGIDIHEQPVAAPRTQKKLAAGNIISAEPGIYIPGRFGVRIEDMLCITPDGCLDLTNAPKQLTICK